MDFDLENPSRILSQTKKVEWIFTGDLCISRRKVKEDGTFDKYSYEIYINPSACRKIVEKKNEILESLTRVKTGALPNPFQIELSLPRVMQLVVYSGAPKLGIHKIDGTGNIMKCVGLNLSPSEFNALMKFLVDYPPPPEEEEACNNFEVKTYGWKWIPASASDYSNSYSDNKWYVSAEHCFTQAESSKPLPENGTFELEISSKRQKVNISDQLVDAAVAQIIKHNYNVQETLQAMENPYYNQKWMELGLFASENLSAVSLREVFALCLKALKLSEKNCDTQVPALMKVVMKRGIHSDALQLVQEEEALNGSFSSLFQYLLL